MAELRRPKPLKPTLDTPNTVLVGIYSDGATAGVVVSLRTLVGALQTNVATAAGPVWTALRSALDAAAMLQVPNLVIFSNDAALIAAISPPFPAPAADRSERHWFGRGDCIDAGCGGNADHWACLAELGGRYGGRFNAIRVDDLRRAKEAWQQLTK